MSVVDTTLEIKKLEARKLLLTTDLTQSQIGVKVKLSNQAVSRIKQDIDRERNDGAIQALTALKPSTILRLADEVAKTDPSMARALTKVSDGLASLDKLNPMIHEAIGNIVAVANKKILAEDVKLPELVTLSNVILKAYATVNHRGATTVVNVSQQQNVIHEAEERIKGLTKGLIIDAEEIKE